MKITTLEKLSETLESVAWSAVTVGVGILLLLQATPAHASYSVTYSNATNIAIRCANTTGTGTAAKWDNTIADVCSGGRTAMPIGSTLWHGDTDGGTTFHNNRTMEAYPIAATTTPITSATYYLKAGTGSGGFDLVLTEAMPETPGSVDATGGAGNTDYHRVGSVQFSNRVAAPVTANVYAFTLNAAGLAYLNSKIGSTATLSVRSADDLDSATPGADYYGAAATPDRWLVYNDTPTPTCTLNSAVSAALASGEQTIYARGTCAGFYPTSAWLGAVRIDPVGSHKAWSEGVGPFPDPYELETTDGMDQILSNGTWRVRMYAMDGTDLVVSGYTDVVLDGNPYTFLTDTGTPGDWDLDPDDALLTASTTGETGYTFSASTAAIVAAGGLVITPDGCGSIGEDATSTTCVFQNNGNWLQRTFPLLTWPTGIFQAFFEAASNTESGTETYRIGLPSHGNWIPAVVLVDSASRTLGIGQWIPVAQQDFFRSIMTFGVWAAFVYQMKRRADRLV